MRPVLGPLIPVCALAMACGGGGGGGGGKSPTPTAVPITTFYVRSSGNDDNSGASPDRALKTVARAAQLLGPGVTVYVGPGTYSGTVKISSPRSTAMRPIFLIADPDGAHTGDKVPGEVLLDGGEGNAALRVENAPSVTVDGFVLTGVASNEVVLARTSDHFTIRNCMVLETASVTGIHLDNANDALIFDNVVDVDGVGVLTEQSQRVRIISNTIVTDNATNVKIGSESSSVTLRNNIIDSDRTNVAISVEDTARPTFDGDYNLVFTRALRPDDQQSAYRPQALRGDHDVNEDALFVDRNGGRYELQPESPAVNAGNGFNVDTVLMTELGARSTAEDGSPDSPPVDLGYHYPAAE